MTDRLRRRVLWALPSGLYVIGSRHGSACNLMAANLVVQVATEPAQLAVAVEVSAVTDRLVREGGSFTVSLLHREDRAVVRHFAKPVDPGSVAAGPGGELREMGGEAVLEAPSGAPVLARAAAWVDCAVRHRLPLGSHDLFVGEVTAVDGPDGPVPPVLRMEDTRMNYGG